MARILCITSSVPGSLYPGVELCRRLVEAGHRVTHAGFAEARSAAAANGLDFMPLSPSRYHRFLAADSRRNAASRLLDLPSRRRAGLASLAVDELPGRIREARPDLVLIDGEMHEQILAASVAGVPTALLNSFVSIWRRPGLPPPHHLARPGVGWKGTRPGSWLLWRVLRLTKATRAWRLRIRHLGCDRLSLLRLLARRTGFDFRRETDSGQWLKPFTYRNLPVLSMHALEFEFPHRPPRRVRYVGPLVLERRGDPPLDGDERTRLAALFANRRQRGRTLIYAGFGSFLSTDLGFLRRLAAAVTERPDWDLVLSLGGRKGPAELGVLPPRVHAFGWLPQLEVLRHADVAVTHGGINTVDECVLAGVPMLVYCGFETDMAGITSRVVHHGLGIAGDRRQDGPRTLGERIQRLVNDRQFRRAVGRLGDRYRAYAENRVAERAVAALLAGRPTASAT